MTKGPTIPDEGREPPAELESGLFSAPIEFGSRVTAWRVEHTSRSFCEDGLEGREIALGRHGPGARVAEEACLTGPVDASGTKEAFRCEFRSSPRSLRRALPGPSCFSRRGFASYLNHGGRSKCIRLGFGGDIRRGTPKGVSPAEMSPPLTGTREIGQLSRDVSPMPRGCPSGVSRMSHQCQAARDINGTFMRHRFEGHGVRHLKKMGQIFPLQIRGV